MIVKGVVEVFIVTSSISIAICTRICMYIQLLACTDTCVKDVFLPSFETQKSTQADHRNNNK